MIDSTLLKNMAKDYKVLIIEDDIKLQNKFKQYFNDFFKNSFITSNEDKALELFDTHTPQIVIVNIDIEETQYFKLIKKFKEKNIFSQVIVISDNTQMRILLNCIHSGVTEYQAKPVNFEVLERNVMKALNNLYLYQDLKDRPVLNNNPVNDSNPFEDIQKLSQDQVEKLTLISNFKGVQIKHDSQLLEIKGENLVFKTAATQLYAIKYEGAAVIRTPHISREILTDVKEIDFKNNKVYLCNPKYIGSSSQVRKDIRIEPDNKFIVSMYKANGQSIDTVLVDISISSLSVKIPESVKMFEEKENINVKIQLSISRSDSYKNVEQRDVLACKAQILSIKKIDTQKKVIILTELSNHDEDILSKYILEREMVLIEEFKKFIISERRKQ
mgnify:CR=1 FL=1